MNCIAVALFGASAAQAQVAPATPEQASTAPQTTGALAAGDDDSIVVTGSRISRAEIDSPTPLVSYSEADIALSGRINLTDFLAQNPALLGSVTSVQTSGTGASPGATGVNLLNLRNLGTQRTLVLVDGRRHVAGLPGTAAVDVSTIPTDLVERVDVTTGAASAIYGADAVSGVVNFALKRDFVGLTARAQTGISEYGDGGNRLLAFTAGSNFAGDRGNVALAYEFRDTDRVSTTRRSESGDPLAAFRLVRDPDDVPDDATRYDEVLRNDIRWADSSRDGAIDLDGDGIPDFTGSGKVYDRGTVLDGGLAQGGDSTPLAGYDGDAQAANRVHNVNLVTSFQVAPAIRVFAQGKFVDTRSVTEAQPNYDFYTYLAPDNAYLNDRFGVDASANGALLTRDHVDLGRRGDDSSRQTYRSVVGIDGDIGGVAKFEASYVHGRTDRTSVSTNNLVADRYYAALDAVRDDDGTIVCRSDLEPDAAIDPNNYGQPATTFTAGPNSGCKPLNLLGENVASAEAIDFVVADVTRKSRVLQHVLSGSVSGDLGGFLQMPGGAIGYAFGGEYRAESSRYQPDELSKQGMLINSSQEADEYGSFDVKEVFGEVRVPIAKGARFFDTLELNAALRVSDYSTVGNTTTWQVSGVWAPVRDVRFRATYSQAVRAPNISELFAPSSGTFGRVDDPCDKDNLDRGTDYRTANCQTLLAAEGLSAEEIATYDPSSNPASTGSIAGRTGGNRDLKEETATTFTAGVVIQPRFLPGLMIGVDWYNIVIADAINTAGLQTLVELCVDQPTTDNVYCENVSRSAGTGYVDDFYVAPQNVASYRTRGVDFQANYRMDAGSIGLFNIKLVGSYLDRLDYVATPGAVRQNDLLDETAPRYSGSFDLTWTNGPLTLNYGLAYNSKTRRYSEETLAAEPDISDPVYFYYREKWEHDIQASIDVGTDYTFYFGVNNLTGRIGDVDNSSRPYSYVGRSIYAGARLRFPGL